MKKLLIITSTIIASIVCLNFSAVAAEKVNWTGYTFHPNTSTVEFKFLERIAEDVAKDTNGNFNIKMVVGGSLPIKGADIGPATADNIVQLGVLGSASVGFVPIYGLARLPLLYETKDELWKAMDNVVMDYIASDMDSKGVKLLAMYSYPYHSVWTIDKPVKTLSDLNGLKIRTMTPPQAELLKSYGAVTVSMATAEVAAALQQNVIDGYLTASAGAGKLWIDSVKYNYRTRLTWGPGMVGANKDAFDKLPTSYQESLIKAAKKWSEWVTDEMYNNEESLTEQFVKEKGLIVTPSNAEDIAEAREKAREVWRNQAKKIGPEAEKALEEVITLLNK
jgi:TRAP-type C4-dicarboxylate transport system substrate-binding protein